MRIMIMLIIIIAGGIALYKSVSTDYSASQGHTTSDKKHFRPDNQGIYTQNSFSEQTQPEPDTKQEGIQKFSEAVYSYSAAKSMQNTMNGGSKADEQLFDKDFDDDLDDELDDDSNDGDKKISDDEYLTMGMIGGLGIFDDE